MKIINKLALIGCIGLLAVVNANAQQKSDWITIKGQLKGFSNQAEIEDLSEFQYLLPPSAERMIVPDANGNFSIKFKASAPNYYRLGRNSMYLTPGDDLEVYIDKSNPKLATFKGKGTEANTYMKNTPFPKGGSFIEGGGMIKETQEATIAAVEEKAKLRTAELAAVTKVSAEFRRLENARVKADLINSLFSGESYTAYKLKLKEEEVKSFSENYRKLIEPKVAALSKDFTDASLMKMTVYRDIADGVIKFGGKPADIQAIKDWYTAEDLVRKMQKVSDKKELASFNPKIAELKTPAYKAASNKMLQQLMAFGKGDQAVDFVALDLSGKKVSLSSLKGKVVYVDIWATWCGPCMQEMPHFETLKTKYKDNPNVVFVSLSIDDTEAPWKQSVNSRKADGHQWLINRGDLKAYNIVGIPRSLLIDKNFKIIDMNAPMPSEATAVKAIDQLLQ